MTRYRKKTAWALRANAGIGTSSDKVWFGFWLAWTAFAVISLIGELATGGDRFGFACYVLLGINICLLYWRIWHDTVQVIVYVERPNAEDREVVQ